MSIIDIHATLFFINIHMASDFEISLSNQLISHQCCYCVLLILKKEHSLHIDPTVTTMFSV